MWYCAHALVMYYYETGESTLVGHENMYLIYADSEAEAFQKAEAAAARVEMLTPGKLWYDEKPALLKFEGIRKLVAFTISTRPEVQRKPPADGDEVTYNDVAFETNADVQAYLQGKTVKIEFDCVQDDLEEPNEDPVG